MNRRSPPWGAIEAFVTATRFPSFKEAASELGLSASAFSRRVQALEAHIGARLFDRSQAVPTLSPAGRRYLARLEPGYESVRAATEDMVPAAERRPLRVAVSQSLAISWLLPRLARFREQCADIEIELHTRLGTVELGGGAADVGLLYGDGQWADLVSQPLIDLQATIVAAPAQDEFASREALAAALANATLLEPLQPAGLWQLWSGIAGVPIASEPRRLRFDSLQVMYEAAAQGLGLAVGVHPLVDPYLAVGRLARVWAERLPLPGAYHVVALPYMRREPAVQRFWHWIVQEAEAGGSG